MRSALIPFLCSLFILSGQRCLGAPDHKLGIVEVRVQYIEAAQFFDLRELFGRPARESKRLVLRTNENERAGSYLIFRLSEPVSRLPGTAEFRLEVVSSAQPEHRKFTFTLPSDLPKTRYVYLGLTDEPWSFESTKVLAWHLEILNHRGGTMASAASFLWSMP